MAETRSVKSLLPLIGLGVGAGGVIFVVRTVVTRRSEVAEALSGTATAPLVLSVLLGLCAMGLIGAVWTGMLRGRGHSAPAGTAMSWYFVGQLGKYVPGGIWPVVGRAEMAVRGGVPRPEAYGATGVSLLTTYAAAPLVAGAGGLLSGRHTAAGATALLAYVLLWADMSNAGFVAGITRMIAKVSGREVTMPDRSRFFRLVAMHSPAWLLMSLSTSVTASALGAHIGVSEMVYVTSVSWLVGFLVPGVPGGIGVRESVFTALAGPVMGTGPAVTLALVSRVVFIAVDVAGAVVSSVVAGTRRGTSAER